MLIELTVQNIALVESLRLEFARGFNVLTGETGSGKSIIVDCMNLVLGGRADRDMVRTGTDRGLVQALFDISNAPNAKDFVRELGVECDDDMIAISREVNRNGRNVCRISGVIVPLNMLKRLTGMLLDIHGQHEHQSLMDPVKHIGFLDAFGDEKHQELRRKAAELCHKRSALSSELKKMMTDAAEKARLTDMLTFQADEIRSAKLKKGEEDRITERMRVLENAERIREGIREAYTRVYQGEGRAPSAQESLLTAQRSMEAISDMDKRYGEIADRLREAYDITRDIGYDLQALLENIRSDPELLEKLSARLDLIDKLERKYGPTLDDVIAFGERAKERLSEIQTSDDRIAENRKELRKLDAALREICVELRQSRLRLADTIGTEVMRQLGELGMGKTKFVVEVRDLPKPTSDGMDGVEFMISTNPGEPLKPMASIASGGELSRIMLALKAIAMDVDGVESMVFDEIDTGVSGRMAQVVGEKMCRIARNRQVLCVTHLPQIAALGDAQYVVEKRTEGERTNTYVRRLDDAGRIRELSRLVGGSEDNESSLSHAENMLREAEKTRAALENE